MTVNPFIPMYMYKTFPAFPISPATATAAIGTSQRHNGTAKRQRNGGNQALLVPAGCDITWLLSANWWRILGLTDS